MQPYTLFIVDDHRALLDGLQAALSAFSHISIVGDAVSYDEALEKLSDPSFSADIILTDHALGTEFNGLDLCRAAKLLRPEQRVVLLTMHNSDALRYRALRARIDCYIVKSSPIHEIVAHLDDVICGNETADNLSSVGDAAVSPALATTELSTRELEVLWLITSEELTTKQIAERLCRSVQTIEAHRAHLFQKLGVDSVVGLVKYAMSIGLCSGLPNNDHSGNA